MAKFKIGDCVYDQWSSEMPPMYIWEIYKDGTYSINLGPPGKYVYGYDRVPECRLGLKPKYARIIEDGNGEGESGF